MVSANDEPLGIRDEYVTEPVPIRKYGPGKPKLCLKVKKTRRGWGAKKSRKQINFSILGNNSNGIKAKKDSLINTLNFFNRPSCVLLQETKLRFPGSLKIKGYQIFEKIRKGLGGGLLTAIDEDLSPLLISSGDCDVEILVVQVQVEKEKIRIINAYGPQETENKEKIVTFWQEFEKEIIRAKDENCWVVL